MSMRPGREYAQARAVITGCTSRPVPAPLQIEVVPHPLGLRVHVRGEETFANTVACWRSIHAHLAAAKGAACWLSTSCKANRYRKRVGWSWS
jgi:hypothetical protein